MRLVRHAKIFRNPIQKRTSSPLCFSWEKRRILVSVGVAQRDCGNMLWTCLYTLHNKSTLTTPQINGCGSYYSHDYAEVVCRPKKQETLCNNNNKTEEQEVQNNQFKMHVYFAENVCNVDGILRYPTFNNCMAMDLTRLIVQITQYRRWKVCT